jgi:hypothetical protein
MKGHIADVVRNLWFSLKHVPFCNRCTGVTQLTGLTLGCERGEAAAHHGRLHQVGLDSIRRD